MVSNLFLLMSINIKKPVSTDTTFMLGHNGRMSESSEYQARFETVSSHLHSLLCHFCATDRIQLDQMICELFKCLRSLSICVVRIPLEQDLHKVNTFINAKIIEIERNPSDLFDKVSIVELVRKIFSQLEAMRKNYLKPARTPFKVCSIHFHHRPRINAGFRDPSHRNESKYNKDRFYVCIFNVAQFVCKNHFLCYTFA